MPNAPAHIDTGALTTSICKGIEQGNKALIDTMVAEGKRVHDLRGLVDANLNKLHEHDTEIRLFKGIVVMLMGSGDGTSGVVPRVTSDVADLKNDMGQVKRDISGIRESLEKIAATQVKQGSWKDQVTGGATAVKVVIGGVIAGVGTLVTIAVWLMTHSVTIK